MRVLSLFDGISAGQLALQRAGIDVETYYASEIDKYAIQVTKKNFPNTIHLGDITKWQEWDIDWSSIDLVIGGSPCQGFSFAGKQLNFEDPRSRLFFVFVDICHRVIDENPKMKFLLENVRMKKEYQDVITQYMGVSPIAINSSLVSAQNRYRLYWTNISNVNEPDDKGILLRDIIQNDIRFDMFNTYNNDLLPVDLETFSNRRVAECTESNKDIIDDVCIIDSYNNKVYNDKSPTITTRVSASNLTHLVKKEQMVVIEDKYYLTPEAIEYMSRLRNGKPRWEYHKNPLDGKAACLTANMYKGVPYGVIKALYRKLTPIECERLQTFPDNWTEGISNSQRYKALGNSWTVDVITHIFKNL